MNAERPPSPNAEDCCPTGSCCEPTSAPGSKSRAPWRAIAFIVIVGAALGVVGYSLMTGEEVEATHSAVDPVDDARLAWIGDSVELERAVKGNDFVFVVMPATEAGDGVVMQAAVGAARQARARGRRVEVVELTPDSPAYAVAAERYELDGFPVVLAMASDGSVRAVRSEVSEQTLLKAYLECCPPAGCCPAGKSAKGCDPTACGK